ncbi:uncharacterized protein LOC131153295 [Malania oleifera]|uniref:uncharacterized protein LOC131153295 n=1 Tax=Malania oleifera TaxID=397392 RepID=UPI0025ADFB7F|nr:uncharacterized protein LOC131153295 [Malania oleifera]
MPSNGFSLLSLFLLLLVVKLININEASSVTHVNGSADMVPLIEPEKLERMMLNESRRKLGSFQICALCTCCSSKAYCVPTPCCYAINCNIPNRPFGFCSFTPKTCNCFGCHL